MEHTPTVRTATVVINKSTLLQSLLAKLGLFTWIYIHTYIPLTLYPRIIRGIWYSSVTPTFYHNYLTMRDTADVTGGKPIAVCLLSISGVSAINPLIAFYDIHGRKREVLFFYFVPDTTRDKITKTLEFNLILSKTYTNSMQKTNYFTD
jgi:hypothetical protein